MVADVAVVGVIEDDCTSEVPKAYVVPKEGSLKGEKAGEDIYSFAFERLSHYKALDGGVVFVSEIPRTASGKTQRFKLLQDTSN